MSRRIVFFDIDGTLLGRDGKISRSTKEALKKLKENGVLVAIATGRAPFMFKTIRQELEVETYVSFNGQYVVFENEVIHNQYFAEEDLQELVLFSNKNGHSLVFQDHQNMRANKRNQFEIKESLGSIRFSHPDVDPNYYVCRPINQTLLFCDEKDDSMYCNRFPQFDFTRWHRYATDVLPTGGSKAKGIQKIIDRLATTLDHVYAFGDGLNDVDMLREVGTGIAMGNGREEVKQIADYITDDVDDDGIAKGLKKFGLIT